MWSLNLDRSRENCPEPLGFRITGSENEETKKREKTMKEMKLAKAWEVSNRPFQSLISTVLMLYMSGSTLNIFSIIFVGMAMWSPIKATLTVNSAFAPYEGEGISLFLPKLKYLAIYFLALFAGLYKFSDMGLIPTNAEDWIGLIPVANPVEVSSGVYYS